MRRRKPRIHKDSVHTEGAGKVTFSRGKNDWGARVDGKKQVLKKKVQEW
jgi:hypothetical protein